MLENDIYILEKFLENILILSKIAGKTFTESCNNPVLTVTIMFAIFKQLESVPRINVKLIITMVLKVLF